MPCKERLRTRWNGFWLYRPCTASFELKDLKTRGDLALSEADHFRYADLQVPLPGDRISSLRKDEHANSQQTLRRKV